MVFTDFMLDGISLSSFGGTLYNSDGYAKSIILPSNTVQCEDVVGIDGQIPYSEKYNPLPIDISGYIENKNVNKEGIINW